MIFQRTYELVLAGRKTQTRRLVRTGRPPCRVGQSIAVQPGRGKKAVGRVRVVAVYQEPLGAISKRDVRAEGFASREEFIAAWRDIHGRFDTEATVWVIEFEPPCSAG